MKRNFLMFLIFIILSTAAIGTGIRPLVSLSIIGIIWFFCRFWLKVNQQFWEEEIRNMKTVLTKEEVENMWYEKLSAKDKSLIRFVEVKERCGIYRYDPEYYELMKYKREFLEQHGL